MSAASLDSGRSAGLALGPNPKSIGGVKIASIVNFFIGLAIFTGGFVTFEPATYELVLSSFLGV